MKKIGGFRLGFDHRVIKVGIVGLFALVLGNVIWWLNKGLVFHDEGWLLMHFRPGINTLDYSNWHRVGAFLYSENLFQTRLVTTLILSSSAFSLGFSLHSLLNFKVSRWLLGLAFVVFQLVLNAPVVMAPTYGLLSVVALNFSMACFIAYVATKTGNRRSAALIGSGFFLGMIPFIQVTASLVIPAFVLFWLAIGDSSSRRTDFACLISGLLAYPVFYFIFIQNPVDFLNKFNAARAHLRFDEDYGFYGIIKWHGKLLLHFIGIPFVLIGLSILLAEKRFLQIRRIWLIAVLLISLVFQLYVDITFQYSVFAVTLWYCLFFVLLWTNRKDLPGHWRNLALPVFFSVLPYLASLGTVVRFQYKASYYFPLIAVAILLQLRTERLRIFRPLFTGLALVAVFTFVSYNFRSGWSGYRITEQKTPISLGSGNGILYLDSARVVSLGALAPHIRGKSGIIASHKNLWGYIWLLHGTPQYLHFRFNPEYFKHYVEVSGGSKLYSTIFVELNRKPFPASFKSWLKNAQIDGWELQRVELEQFTIYSFQRNANENV